MTADSAPTTVAIIEDTNEFLAYFAEIVSAAPDFHLAGTATSGREGKKLIDARTAQIYLIDIGLPDVSGIDLIRHSRAAHPESEVMVITMFGDESTVLTSIEAGATGYLLKDSSEQEFRDALRALRNGGSPVSPAVARKILRRFAQIGPQEKDNVLLPAGPAPAAAEPAEPVEPAGPSETPGLTTREVQILRLLAKGLTFGDIGAELAISAHTVAKHVKNIYRKLAVKSRGEAVYAASKFGIIDL